MVIPNTVTLTIGFIDPELEPEDRDDAAQRLMQELREIDEVESVGRVLDPNPPEGNKALGGFLVGRLAAEVSVENAKKVLGFLGDRLGGKSIQFSVEDNGRKLSVTANSCEELEAAVKAAKDFLAAP